METDRVIPGGWTMRQPLDDELVAAWHRWYRGRRGRARVTAWARAHPAVRGWTVEALAAPVGSLATDRMQAALVELAQEGDVEAAFTLAVQLRPGLLRLVRSITAAASAGRSLDVRHEVQAVFFETLYRHDLGRRPAHIAANLLLDTRQRVTMAWRRAARLEAVSVADPAAAVQPGAATGSERYDLVAVVEAIAATVAGMGGSAASRRLNATLAHRAWMLDEPRREIAHDLGLDPEVVTTRLHRVRNALRQAGIGAEWEAQLPATGSLSDGSAPASQGVGPSWRSR